MANQATDWMKFMPGAVQGSPNLALKPGPYYQPYQHFIPDFNATGGTTEQYPPISLGPDFGSMESGYLGPVMQAQAQPTSGGMSKARPTKEQESELSMLSMLMKKPEVDPTMALLTASESLLSPSSTPFSTPLGIARGLRAGYGQYAQDRSAEEAKQLQILDRIFRAQQINKPPIQRISNDLAIALRRAGVPSGNPDDASPEQLDLAVKLQNEAYAQKQAGAAVGRGEADLYTPMSRKEASNYINWDTGERAPIGLTPTEAEAQGFIYTVPKYADSLGDMVAAKTILRQLTDMTNGMITATDPISAASQGATLTIGAWIKSNPQAATYMADQEAFLGRISKSFAGEVGVLTNQDIQRIKQALPQFRDTAQVAQMKWKFVNELVNNATVIAKMRAQGVPFPKEWQAQKDYLIGSMERAGGQAQPSRGMGASQSTVSGKSSDELRKLWSGGKL